MAALISSDQLAFDLFPSTVEAKLADPLAVGFTGTQRGMAEQQMLAFRRLLFLFEWKVFHHGDCIGADAQAHEIAVERGMTTVAHPPEIDTKRAWVLADATRMARSYLDRNRDIVDETSYLIATPGEFEEQLRSGTWATVRYARSLKRCIWLVFPDGSVLGPQP